jgi:hypothetical protein
MECALVTQSAGASESRMELLSAGSPEALSGTGMALKKAHRRVLLSVQSTGRQTVQLIGSPWAPWTGQRTEHPKEASMALLKG